MNEFMEKMLQNMDEDQARQILSNLDDEQIGQAVEWILSETIVPHLQDIRDRAQADPSTEEVRQHFESMSKEEREEEFYETLDNFVATLVLCRRRPDEGFKELKAYLRDPFTAEALLLIFENEDHIDYEYTQQLKDFGVTHLRWVGAYVLPEMYSESELQSVDDQIGVDQDTDGFSG